MTGANHLVLGLMFLQSNRLRKIISIILSLMLIIYIMKEHDIQEYILIYSNISWGWISILFTALVFNFLVVSYRLKYILGRVNISINTINAIRASASGLLSSLIMPSLVGGLVGRQWVLYKLGISVEKTVAITAYERIIISFISAILMLIGSFFLFGSNIIIIYIDNIAIIQIILSISISFIMLFGVFGHGPIRELASRTLSLQVLTGSANTGAVTLLAQFCAISCYTFGFLAMGVRLDFLTIFAGAAIVSFIAALPISVNGWGVREFAAIKVFGALGIPATDAVSCSVLVGLCSTIMVLAAAPIALKGSNNIPPQPPSERYATNRDSKGRRSSFERDIALAAGIAIAILLFFQIRIEGYGIGITVNLADPLALFAGATLILGLVFQKRSGLQLTRPAQIWLGLTTATIIISFLIGYWRFGLIPWAFSNRLFGWMVLLGYLGAGSALVRYFGIQGRTRLMQALLLTGAIVVLVHLAARAISYIGLLDWQPPFRFEGFSANRNALAFQLCIVTALYMIGETERFIRSSTIPKIASAFTCFGIFASGSMTGIITLLIMSSFFVLTLPERRRTIIACLLFGISLWTLGIHLAPIFISSFVRLISTIQTALQIDGFQLNNAPRPTVVPGLDYVPISFTQRFYSLRIAFDIWLNQPLFGSGLGVGVLRSTAEGLPLVIHSTFAWLLAETGILGFIVTLAYPAIVAWRHICTAFRHKMSAMPQRARLVLAILLPFGLFSLTHDVGYQRIMWVLIGAALAFRSDERNTAGNI